MLVAPLLAHRPVFELLRLSVNSYSKTVKKYTPQIEFSGFFQILHFLKECSDTWELKGLFLKSKSHFYCLLAKKNSKNWRNNRVTCISRKIWLNRQKDFCQSQLQNWGTKGSYENSEDQVKEQIVEKIQLMQSKRWKSKMKHHFYSLLRTCFSIFSFSSRPSKWITIKMQINSENCRMISG